ncbi:hypothetical protein [Streptomyces sp. NBC_01481]|uniref:hypothetical protein n=1 Tax=Streptomyces sp. NBC_01481 TaxID=2975869 RepID=UPI00224FA56F|nr:hypothetical protein [Streptomyces sp. NBC_01481]MCX4587063.1 hypothetical protein [Streptomyces sp. NBC_01481]
MTLWASFLIKIMPWKIPLQQGEILEFPETDQSDMAGLEPLACCLLRTYTSWRVRSVQHIELTSAQWSERSRTIDVQALTDIARMQHDPATADLRRELNSQFGSDVDQWPDSKTLILPIASFPKEPLLDFQITVDDQPAYRISRKETARLKAKYMAYLAKQAHLLDDKERILEEDSDLSFLLSAIFAFRPTTWHGMRKWNFFKAPLWTYLKRAIPGKVLNRDRYATWKEIQKDIKEIVKRQVVSTHKSATQNPILALPDLLAAQPQLPTNRIHRILSDLKNLLDAAERVAGADPESEETRAARKLLSTYSSYGWRWEAITVCRVPLNKPFIIKVKEKRSIYFDAPKRDDIRALYRWPRDLFFPRARHHLSFHDAGSNYVHISAPDNSVRPVKLRCRAFNDTWKKLPTARKVNGSADDELKSAEYYSRYDSSESRDERIWVECRLSQTVFRSMLHWGIIAITISAIWLLLYLVYAKNYSLGSKDVATILIPATFAATLLLAADASTLGRRVKRLKQLLLLAALVTLWCVTLTLYIKGHISIDEAQVIWRF